MIVAGLPSGDPHQSKGFIPQYSFFGSSPKGQIIDMAGTQDIWVVIEHAGGSIKPVSLEAIQAARLLAGKTGGQVKAVLLSSQAGETAGAIVCSGVDQVFVVIHPQLETYTSSRYLDGLKGLIEKSPPAAVLLPATNHGKELAPALAASLGSGLATDCISLDYTPDKGISVQRPVYAGKALSVLEFNEPGPVIITLRPNAFRAEDDSSGKDAETFEHSPEFTEWSQLLNLKDIVKGAGALDITESRIVVSGGLGMQSPDNFQLLEELAQVLGGAVGASRPVVDNGWRDYSSQVGQTGRTVGPDLYIACGISGAVQHLAGMSSSKCIVAINKDPNAPIFDVADYGIVGDALQILPILTQEFREALQS
jgi:electron transfer flavoprotein alpha subunit